MVVPSRVKNFENAADVKAAGLAVTIKLGIVLEGFKFGIQQGDERVDSGAVC